MQLATDCHCEGCLWMRRKAEREAMRAVQARRIIQQHRRRHARRSLVRPIAAFGEHCHSLWVQHGDKAARKLRDVLRDMVRQYFRGVISAREVCEELDSILTSFRQAAEANCNGV